MGIWVCLIWRAIGSLKDLHSWADPCCVDAVWRRKVRRTSSQTQGPKVDVSWWAKHCLSMNAIRPFINFLGSVTFHGLGKTVSGTSGGFHFGPSLRAAWLDGGGCPLPLELGARFWLLEQFRVLATWRLAWNALSILCLDFKAGLADMPACPHCISGLEEMAEHAFYYCEWVCPFWDHIRERMARIERKQPVLFDVGYVIDNVLPLLQGEKHVVFLVILAIARMVIWTTWKKGLYDDANFSHPDLILFFRHQLRVKIRCDRKCLDCITFHKRWVNAVSLVIWQGTMWESSFPSLPVHCVYGLRPSEPYLR